MIADLESHIYRDVDGFYYYDPPGNRGCYSAHTLREIADKLDEMNKDWEEVIAKEIGHE